MAGFVAWLVRYRLRRVAFVAGLFLLPITSVISAAIIVLTADLKGPAEAAKDMVLAFVVLAVVMLLPAGDASPVPFLVSVSLSWSIALLLVAAMLLFVAVVGDVAAFWQQLLTSTLAELPPDLVTDLTAEFTAQGITTEQMVALVSQILTPAFAVGLLVSSLMAVLLGCSWASAARNESFGQRFRGLKLGYVIGGFAAVMGILSLFGFALASGLLLIVSIGFMLQGIAVLYCWAEHKQWPGAWWAAVVLPLVFMPVMPVPSLFMGFGLAATGFIDNWYALRPKTA